MEKSNLPFFQYDDHLSVLVTPFFFISMLKLIYWPPLTPLWLGLVWLAM